MKHAVIFDIDGTLLNSSADDEQLYKGAIRQVVGGVRFRDGLDDYEHVTDGGILLEILDDNGIAPTSDLVAEIKDVFFRDLDRFVRDSGPFREVPGARAVLRRLRASPAHAVAIATGSWQQSAKIKLESAGIDSADMTVANSDHAIERTGIMRYALDALGSGWASITYFGDGRWDQRACAELGWTFRAVGPVLKGLASFDDEYPERE